MAQRGGGSIPGVVSVIFSPFNELINVVAATFYFITGLFSAIFFRKEQVGVVSSLRLYPGRAMPGIHPKRWFVGETGFLLDKRLCLWEDVGNPHMAGARVKHNKSGSENLYNVSVSVNSIDRTVFSYEGKPNLVITYATINPEECVVCDVDGAQYLHLGAHYDQWFSDIINRPVRMMFCPYKNDMGVLNIPQYTHPALVFSHNTMEQVCIDAGREVEVERFRPNIIIEGCEAYADETWQEIRIGNDVVLEFEERCQRCLIVNGCKNQVRSPDTFDYLRRCRPKENGMPVLGTYYTVKEAGFIDVGDKVVVLKKRPGH